MTVSSANRVETQLWFSVWKHSTVRWTSPNMVLQLKHNYLKINDMKQSNTTEMSYTELVAKNSNQTSSKTLLSFESRGARL